MNALELENIGIDGSADIDGEVEITADGVNVWINKTDAIKIIRHLTEVLDLGVQNGHPI